MSSYAIEMPSQNALFASASRRNEILSLINQIRELFERYFDRSWLAIVIDDLPMDRRTVRDIREFLALSDLFPEHDQQIESGIEGLHRYIWTLKTHLVPNVKELLGVSPFSTKRRQMDTSQYILRRLTAYVLPHNLVQLEAAVDELETRFKG